jgi:hypothetical protein
MIQQVNLYQDSIKDQPYRSDFNRYLYSLIAFGLLLLCISADVLWNTHVMETEVEQGQVNLQSELAKVALIAAKIPKQEINSRLAAEVSALKSQVDELTQMTELLSANSAAKSPGFSGYLQALSNQVTPEVWLSALFINEQQQIINIDGSTFQPEQIPNFLQQLQKEVIFNGHTFAKLVMEKSKDSPEQMDFKLSTHLDADNKKDHVK